MSCQGILKWILKMLNFVLSLVGAGLVLYALWMLKQWLKYTPSAAPAPAPVEAYQLSAMAALEELPLLSQPAEIATGQEMGMPKLSFSFVMNRGNMLTSLVTLPAPWFIYGFLIVGGIACFVTFIGHIAAETANSCCLCFYTTLLGLLLIVQGAVMATVFFDNHWRDDLPKDPTGQLDKVYAFVVENYEIFKWVGLAIVIVQGLALLVSSILRAVADAQRSGYDSDDDYLPRTQRPAVQRQATTAANGAGGDSTTEARPAARGDEWSKRMREKYGLDTNEFTYNPSDSRRGFAQQGAGVSSGEEKKACCTIM